MSNAVLRTYSQRASVNGVASRLDAGIDHSAGGVAKLSGVVAGLHLEFWQSIRRRLRNEASAVVEVHYVGVVVHAIENEVVLFSALSIGLEVAFAAAARTVGNAAPARELRDVDPVAAVQGNAVDGLRAMVWPTELSCVCMSGASVVTVTVSDVAPGLR